MVKLHKENINLNINREKVAYIIVSAPKLQAKEGVSFFEEMANAEYEYDPLQILASHTHDLTFIETKRMIDELDVDQKIDLLALLYVGRGDYGANEWSAARQEAENNLAPQLAKYLLSKPQLSEYLEEGLSSLGYSLSGMA